MKFYETKIEIASSPARVWQTLTSEMPRNPEHYGIVRFEGNIALQSKIKLWSEVVPDRAFSLKVIRFDAPNEMAWRGGMPFGLFVGTRTFAIAATEYGSAFRMREEFSGLFAGPITKSMPDLTPSFIKFANTLKQEAERND
ncbi:MAG: SRPBCC domain-containing protein [Hyphomicrobiales bacterium]